MDEQENWEEGVIYSAELRHADGAYFLTINDHLGDRTEVFPVSRKAVKRVPLYLSALRSRLP